MTPPARFTFRADGRRFRLRSQTPGEGGLTVLDAEDDELRVTVTNADLQRLYVRTPASPEEVCARAALEAAQLYSLALGEAASPAWEHLTDAERDGRIAAVKHALAGGSAEDQHNLWMATRRAEGWTFGPMKDTAAKTSPCLVPYGELPEAQRRKDALFQGVVRSVAAALGIAPAEPSREQLAEVAFAAYGAAVGGKTYDGKPIPPLATIRENTPRVAAAWEAAAGAVRDRVVRP